MDNQVKQQARAAQFEKFQAYAIEKGGVLLSTEYRGTSTKLDFRCAAGHTFSSWPGSMWHGKTWCKSCSAAASRNRQLAERDFLGELQEIAAQRGGACLSTKYVRSDVKLRFACADGHEWDSRPNDVRRGTWCPSCANKTEGMVRRYLECRFGQPMPSRRLPWLIDSEGKQRVLDGYSEELKLAFEYHGVQHFEHTKFFHTDKTLEQQQVRDAFVREACVAAGVTLLEITSLPDGYTQADFTAHLAATLATYLTLPPDAPGGLEQFLAMPERISKLTEVQALAQTLGGRCLSTKFISTNSKLTWECAKGHTWDAIPKTVKKGHWCPYCSNCRRVAPLDDLRKLAYQNGGICRSTEYINNSTPLKFTCAHGHDFESAPTSLWDQKSWCPVCAGNRVYKPLERLAKIARSKGGTLLSTEYVNGDSRVSFRCGEGHEWSTTAKAIVYNDSWCKRCACKANALKQRASTPTAIPRPRFSPLASSRSVLAACSA